MLNSSSYVLGLAIDSITNLKCVFNDYGLKVKAIYVYFAAKFRCFDTEILPFLAICNIYVKMARCRLPHSDWCSDYSLDC